MKSIATIGLLTVSNVFMTLAWYGHLKLAEYKWFSRWGLFAIVLLSWGLAFFEYCAQVPANKIGFTGTGGPFSLLQLKILQEVITLIIFVGFTLVFFKNEQLRWNHLVGSVFLILAIYFFFKK